MLQPESPQKSEHELTEMLRTCTNKVRYESRGSAESMGRRRTEKTGLRLYTYHCQFCYGYHLSRKLAEDSQIVF